MTMNYITADGGTLAVELRGEGPLVVCSPAMGDFRDAYDPFAARLVAAGFRVAQFDLRGHGDSSTGFGSYGDLATASDMLTIVDELGDGPAFLVGASLSAGAALVAGSTSPEKVAGVVLLAPFLRNPAGGKVAALALQAMLARPWGPSVWRGYSASLWPGLGSAGAKARAAETVARTTRPGRWREFVATTRGADHSTVAPYIPGFHTPALVVIGDKDRDWKDPLAEAAWVAEQTAATDTVVVHGAGHAPMLERPDEVADAVIPFLQGVSSRAEGRA